LLRSWYMFINKTSSVRSNRKGRPTPNWSQILQRFSAQELHGTPQQWQTLATNRAQWTSFADLLFNFVEVNLLRADTRATSARDDIRAQNM
jgi:hypothetical protein